MERHAVPQNIMEVQFKLFGSLTVKQFAYMAGGFLVALAIYFSPLIDFVKYPLIFVSAILGLFFSVGQINGQPSTVWVSNFIAALFTSQERVWKKTAVTPEIFKEDLLRGKAKEDEVDQIIGKKNAPVIVMNDAPLIAVPDQVVTKFDTEVDDRLQKIDDHFKFLYEELPKNFNAEISQPPKQEEIKKQTILQEILSEDDANTASSTPVLVKEAVGNYINIIKGIVFDKKGQIISDAQIYIKDSKDLLVRKVLTDKEGKFALSTSLPDGQYYIDIESKGCKFPRFKVLLNGSELPIYKFSES